MKIFNLERKSASDMPSHGRRRLLRIGSGTLAGCLAGPAAVAATLAPALPVRTLRLYNIHTGESTKSVYWEDNVVQPEGLANIARLLRDYRSGEVGRIDKRLLDLLYALSISLDTQESFHVISGYRSSTTNAMLRQKSHGVARHSLHMEGLAIDIRVPGRDLAHVRRAVVALGNGGVGYYPASDFVHVDVGRVRSW